MTLINALRTFLGAKKKPIRRNDKNRKRVQLRLENLEERVVPTTWMVTDNSDTASDTASLRYAFNHAVSGDVINLAPLCAGSNATITLAAGNITNNTGSSGVMSYGAADFVVDSTQFGSGGNLTIEGPTSGNYGVTIVGAAGARLFTDNKVSLTLINVTLTGGSATGGAGAEAGASDSASGGGLGAGGAVFNDQGTVTANGVTFTNDTATGGAGLSGGTTLKQGAGGGGMGAAGSAPAATGGGPNGGAIHNGPGVGGGGFGGGGGGGGPGTGTARSGGGGGFGGGGGSANNAAPGQTGGSGGFGGGGGTGNAPGFAGPSAFAGGTSTTTKSGAGAGLGGAIFNLGGTLSVINSTFTGNAAVGGTGGVAGSGFGGAIFSADGSTTVEDSTISGNTAAQGGRGIYVFSGSITLNNSTSGGATTLPSTTASITMTDTIIGQTDMSVTDFASTGSPTMSGSNDIITNNPGGGGFTGTSLTTGVDPELHALTNNSGPTQTMLPYSISGGDASNSPALTNGITIMGIATDQRGVTRGSTVDIGSVQVTVMSGIAPSITMQPSNALVDGSPSAVATFQAAASGTPTPTVNWWVSSTGIGGTYSQLMDGGVYSGSGTDELTITGATTGMNGYYYEAIFTNTSGMATTNPALLTVDNTPPTLTSITDNTSGEIVNASSPLPVVFTLTFSKAINPSTMTPSDFVNSGTAPINTILSSNISQSSADVFTVSVTPTGNGTLILTIPMGANIQDLAGNQLNTTSALSDPTTITVNLTPPTVLITLAGSSPTSSSSVVFDVDFSEAVVNVNAADFVVNTTGGVSNSTPVVVAGGPTDYTVTVNGISGTGTVGLAFAGGENIQDTAGNPLSFASSLTVPNASFETLGAGITLNDSDMTSGTEGVATSTNSSISPGWTYSPNNFFTAGAWETNAADGYFNGMSGYTLPAPASGTVSAFAHFGSGATTSNKDFITSTSPIDTDPNTAGVQNIEAGTAYTMTVAVGVPEEVATQTTFNPPANVFIELCANGSVVADTQIGSSALSTFLGGWRDYSVTLSASQATTYAGDALTIEFQVNSVATSGGGDAACFDNVQLTATPAIGTTIGQVYTIQVAAPTVSGLSPTHGTTAGGTSVVITGTGFTGASVVDFGSTAATTFTVNSSTQITATDAAGSGVVDVTVTTSGGMSATSTSDQFTYATPPTVAGLSPSYGVTTGGTSVVITGTNFLGATTVDFGSTAATTFTINSATQITATDAAGTGVVDVTVTIPIGGTSGTSTLDRFTYVTLPAVSGLSPTTGPVGGNTSVIITGSGFNGTTAVDFGSTAATTFTVNSSTQITASDAAGTGVVDVTVANPVGTSATTTADHFTYVAVTVPTVSGLSPATGITTGGTTVIITGTGFTAATAVDFGSTAATTFTVNSATQITATDAAGATGTVDVTVATTAGTSATSTADQFTYATVGVTNVSPRTGDVAGGQTVTITGFGFNPGTVGPVDFGSTSAATFTVNSSTQITATDPAGTGTVDVTVTVTTGGSHLGGGGSFTSTTSSADHFTYVSPVANGQSISTNENTAVSGTLRGSDADTYALASPAADGSVSINASTGDVHLYANDRLPRQRQLHLYRVGWDRHQLAGNRVDQRDRQRHADGQRAIDQHQREHGGQRHLDRQRCRQQPADHLRRRRQSRPRQLDELQRLDGGVHLHTDDRLLRCRQLHVHGFGRHQHQRGGDGVDQRGRQRHADGQRAIDQHQREHRRKRYLDG